MPTYISLIRFTQKGLTVENHVEESQLSRAGPWSTSQLRLRTRTRGGSSRHELFALFGFLDFDHLPSASEQLPAQFLGPRSVAMPPANSYQRLRQSFGKNCTART